jgi:predicted CopG family antitoxin
MRTTIEIRPDHRAKLLELAARRGEKGFSSVIAEAIDSYLAAKGEIERLRKNALQLSGKISSSEADELLSKTRQAREFWR